MAKIRLPTDNPKKTYALRHYDLEVVGQVPIVSLMIEHGARYLHTKREKLGAQLSSRGR